MKKWFVSLALVACSFPFLTANAQDIPIPAEAESADAQAVADTTETPAAAEPADAPATAETADAPAAETRRKEPANAYAVQLIEFFDGLEKAASGDDCQLISNTIQDYCQKHQAWIDQLDYASGNIDTQTMERIHEKAIAFGKKLSACYDQKSIPALLRQYAGLGKDELE